MKIVSQPRIESLDWLRGLMALSIMIYHLCGWYFYYPDASDFLGRMGIYGVSIFFILSGLSMAVVYHRFIDSRHSLFAFIVRRGFRILPLLWIAILGTVTISTPIPTTPELKLLLLNLTGIFGFISPFGYIAVGSWSIGCEMAFYALTPLLFFAYNYRLWLGNVITVTTFIVALFFAFYYLNTSSTLAQQWTNYIHPLNNLFLYTFGVAIYYNLNTVALTKQTVLIVLAISLIGISFYPAFGNQIELVTGFNRIAFSLFSTLLVIGFYKFNFTLPQVLSYPLEKLGLITYGVYILHPIIKVFITKWFVIWGLTNAYVIASSVIVISIALALLSYYSFEIHLMRLGKKLTSTK